MAVCCIHGNPPVGLALAIQAPEHSLTFEVYDADMATCAGRELVY